jgi:CsoR family transcriptional regulator, copper-sensing transcriptional repressor
MSKISNPEEKKKMLARLSRIEGQLRGIRAMIEAEKDCEQIAVQLSASRKALDRSFFTLVACLIEQGSTPIKRVSQMLSKLA